MRSMALGELLLLLATAACAGVPDEAVTSQPMPGIETFPVRSLSGCGEPGPVGPADVVVVIDASYSTVDPTGVDVNGNGVVGHFQLGRSLSVTSTDPGDSYLGAQVVAVRSLVLGIRGPGLRFAIVAFRGPLPGGSRRSRERESVTVHSELTRDRDSLESGLDRVLEGGSFASTDFAAAIVVATRLLEESAGAERTVLFMSESSKPSIPGSGGQVEHRDPRIDTATRLARTLRVTIHTFELRQPHSEGDLGRIARDTGGTYQAISELEELHCALARPLARIRSSSSGSSLAFTVRRSRPSRRPASS